MPQIPKDRKRCGAEWGHVDSMSQNEVRYRFISRP